MKNHIQYVCILYNNPREEDRAAMRAAREAKKAKKAEKKAAKGKRVKAKNDKGYYYLGRISKYNDDGTYDITYDDEMMDLGKDPNDIIFIGDNWLKEGMRVNAKDDKGLYHPGWILRNNDDGMYDIVYDYLNKNIETKHEKEIRIFYDEDFKKGMRVMADHDNKGIYYPGHISRVNGDDTYDIVYDEKGKEFTKPDNDIIILWDAEMKEESEARAKAKAVQEANWKAELNELNETDKKLTTEMNTLTLGGGKRTIHKRNKTRLGTRKKNKNQNKNQNKNKKFSRRNSHGRKKRNKRRTRKTKY